MLMRSTKVFQNSQFFLFSSLICPVHFRFLLGLCVCYPQITWQPWAPLGEGFRFQFTGGWGASRYRILFEGPVGRAWFLGDRFLRQVWGYTSQATPSAPPVDMRIADRLSSRDVVSAMLGTDALLHLEEGDYATYRHIYLMPPLTGVRTPTMRPAGMPSSSQAQARAADAPSTSRAGTSRGGGGSVSPIPPTSICQRPRLTTGMFYSFDSLLRYLDFHSFTDALAFASAAPC